jgi:hypothetical protein
MTPIPWATDTDKEIIQWVFENRIRKPVVYVELNSFLQQDPDTAEVSFLGHSPSVTRRFKRLSIEGRPA